MPLTDEEQQRLDSIKAKYGDKLPSFDAQPSAVETPAAPQLSQQDQTRLALVQDKIKTSVLRQVEEVGKVVAMKVAQPFSRMSEIYSKERLSAIDTVRDAYENPGWFKTPMGIALGTAQYVMAPLKALAQGGVGEPIAEATEEVLNKNRVGNVEGQLTDQPITPQEKSISKDVGQFVGKLGEEAVYFVPVGGTIRELLWKGRTTPAKIIVPKVAPELEKTPELQALRAASKTESAPVISEGERLISEARPVVHKIEGPIAPLMEAKVAEKTISGITEGAAEALAGNYDKSKRVFKNIAEQMASGEFMPDPEVLQSVLKKHDMDPAQFAKLYMDTVSGAGRVLNYHSQVIKNLKTIFADNPEAVALLEKAYKETPVSTIDKALNAWSSMENFRRSMLVGQVATGVRNAWSQLGRITIGAWDESLQGGLKGVFGGEPVTLDGMRDGLNMVVGAANRFKPEARKRLTNLIDNANDPLAALKLTAQPVHEVRLGGAISQFVNTLNSTQETFFRKLAFESKFRQLLDKKGLDYNTINPKNIPDGFVEEATNYALEMTFAASPKSKQLGDILRIWSKTPMTLINPFPRFAFANALPFIFEHSPLGYLNAVKPSTLKALAEGNTDAFAKAASRATIGSLMLDSAMRIRQSEYAGENWYEIKSGTDKEGKPNYWDTRAFAPLSTYLFVAEAIVNPNRLKPMDYAQAAIGLNRIAGTGLVVTDWLRAKTGESFGKQLKNFTGQYVSSFFTPARTLSDAFSAIDEKENTVRDWRESPIVGSILLNLPKLSQTVPEKPSPLETTRQTKGEDVDIAGVTIPSGIFRQLTGLSKRTKTMVEQEVDRLQIEYSTIAPRSNIPQANREMARYMAPVVEKMAPLVIKNERYKSQPDEIKRMAMGNLFQQARAIAKIQLSKNNPQLALKVAIEALSDDVEKVVKQRNPQLNKER